MVQCFGFVVRYALSDLVPPFTGDQLRQLIDERVRSLPNVNDVISHSTDVPHCSAPCTAAMVICYNGSGGYGSRFKACKAAATEVVRGRATLLVTMDIEIGVTQAEALALKNAAVNVDNWMQVEIAGMSAAADALEALARQQALWEGFVFTITFKPKTGPYAFQEEHCSHSDTLGYRRHPFTMDLVQLSKDVSRSLLQQRNEVRDVAVVILDGAYRSTSPDSGELMIFVKVDKASDKEWTSIYTFLTESQTVRLDHWLCSVVQEDNPFARVVKRDGNTPMDWPPLSHVRISHADGIFAGDFLHNAPATRRKLLHQAMTVAAAEARFDPTDTEQALYKVYNDSTHLGRMVIAALDAENKALSLLLNRQKLDNHKMRQVLAGEKAMDVDAIVPYENDGAVSVDDHLITLQIFRDELYTLREEKRELEMKLEAHHGNDRSSAGEFTKGESCSPFN
jgi:hypothetical protein